MIDLEEARRLAQRHVGDAAELVHVGQPPDGLYVVHPGREFYFFVRRTAVLHVGGTEVAIVDRSTGEVSTSRVGE